MLELDWRFFPVYDAIDRATAYLGAYDLALVATSVVIAILAAFVALSISGRIVAAATQRGRWAWATAGALSMGGGIWSMHFIGMLAFSLPCGITYDSVGTVLSMIPGVLASGTALGTISRPTEPDVKRLGVSAVLMGAGIGTMHYSGMAAMQPEALLRYDPGLVLLSIVVAVVLAFISLSIHFRIHRPFSSGRPETIIAATVMGLAVAGMHYTAMQASIFYPLPDAPTSSMALSPTLLALLITIFTVLIATSTLVATFAGRQNELALSLTAEVQRRQRTEEDLVRAREQAEAANLAKSQFLATMSHEIRTPMNGVLGMANLLISTPLNDRQRRLAETLSRSGKALLATINDILDFSKIEAGRFELFDVDFDPREVIAEVTDLFCEPSASKGLELVYFIAEEVPGKLHGDPIRLRQVLINLVGNAVKFTERGEVLIEIDVAGSGPDHVVLAFSVEDTGIGIASAQRQQVFSSFYQADHAMTRARGGTGLGLTIAKHLVELMGGEIGVTSELGDGSRFWFTVRLGRVAGEADETRASRHVARPFRALLVDTNAVSARVLSLYLSSWRIETTVATNAEEAEAAWTAAGTSARGFDVAIIDVKGLKGAGVNLAHRIHTDDSGRKAKVVALAGIDGLITDDSQTRLGIFATLTKPARPSELFNCLATLASKSRETDVAPYFMRRSVRTQRAQFDARILVVEDNATNQEVAVGMLEAMGCQTVTASNGSIAEERFTEDRFDLVLMDCEMPVMDGFEAARRMRKIEAKVAEAGEASRRRTAIVAVTAHALTAVQQRCFEAGMDDFLVKPYDEVQLAETLRRWLPSLERAPVRSDPRGAADPATIDHSTIEKIRAIKGKGSVELLQRVVTQFTQTSPPLAATIRAKADAGDAEAVWRAAHSLRSSAGAIGARKLSERCAEIETIAREVGAEPVKPLLDALDAELAAATKSLKELT
ncbi:MAG: response regulator [Proteobacteria bacterium]|nr:response regulator [Pseudomonadota bacterium]MBI3499439.1 response regulator [Pseudomonadota bacterium]